MRFNITSIGPASKNALKLALGTGAAQAIPILFSPILTRIFTKADFGVLAMFTALHMIFASIICGGYEFAVMLPRKDCDAANIVAGGSIVAFVSVCFLLLCSYVFIDNIAVLLGSQEITFWIYIIPIVVLVSGIYNLINYWNTRKKLYGLIAKVKVLRASGLVGIQLTTGYMDMGGSGLILGYISARFIELSINAKSIVFSRSWWRYIDLKKIKEQLLLHAKFPLFVVWATLASNLSVHLTTFYLNSYFSLSIVGAYALVYRIMGTPIALISHSVGQVFFQEAAAQKQKNGNAVNIFKRTIIKLSFLSFIIFCPLFFFGKIIFEFVFGSEWAIAGTYAAILSPLFAIRFVVSPLNFINIVFEKQNILFMWQIALLAITIICFTLSIYFKLSMESFLELITIAISIHYLVLLGIVYNVAKGKKDNKS